MRKSLERVQMMIDGEQLEIENDTTPRRNSSVSLDNRQSLFDRKRNAWNALNDDNEEKEDDLYPDADARSLWKRMLFVHTLFSDYFLKQIMKSKGKKVKTKKALYIELFRRSLSGYS